MARPPGPSDPNLDQNYDIFVGTILAFNANVLHAPSRVLSEIRKDPSVTLFFGRTSLSNRNIVLAILLLAGDVHPKFLTQGQSTGKQFTPVVTVSSM